MVAMGCNDIHTSRRLIESPPLSLDEAVRRVRIYQLSRRGLASRRRGVHAVQYSDLSSGEETSRSPSPVLRRDINRVETTERSGTP